jgi:hypothetical protein
VAWEDIDSDLAEMFGEFTTRTDAMLLALEIQVARKRARDREYRETNFRKLRDYFKARYERLRGTPEHEKKLAYQREYQREHRRKNHDRIVAKKSLPDQKARQRVYSARSRGYLNSGRKPGAQPRPRPDGIMEMLAIGLPLAHLHRRFGIARTTLLRWKKEIAC